MAVRQNYYSEDLTTTNTTGTTYVNALSLTFTPDASSTYYLFYSCDINCNVTRGTGVNAGVATKLINTTSSTSFNENSILPYNGAGTTTTTGDWISSFGMASQSFGASPASQTYQLQFKNRSASSTSANVREKTILAVKAGSNDQFTEVAGSSSNNKTNIYAPMATLTFSPNVTTNGKYLLFAFAEVANQDQSNPAMSIRLNHLNIGDWSPSWTQSASGFSTGTATGNGLNGICYGNNLYVVSGTSGSTSPGIGYSSDGITWTYYSPGGINFYLNRITYSSTVGLYVAVGRAGGLITSSDPTNVSGWTQRTSQFGAGAIQDVLWHTANSKYYTAGANAKMFASSDGITWSSTGLSTPVASPTTSIMYNGQPINGIASDGSNLVAVNGSGTIGYSTNNASTWTSLSTNANAFNAVAAGNNIFIAVGLGKIYTSNSTANQNAPTTWTSQTLPSGWTTSTNITNVAYGNGVWMITASNASSGTGTAYSTDNGVTWTTLSNTFGTQSVNGVCFGNSLFVACGSIASTTTNSIARLTAPASTITGTSSIAINDGSGLTFLPWMQVVEKTLSNTSQTFVIESLNQSIPTSGAAYVQNARILALKISDFNAEYYVESRTRSTTTSTTYVDKATLSPTLTAAEHLIFCAGQTDLTVGVNTVLGSIKLLDNTSSTTREEQQATQAFSSGTSQNFPFFNVNRKTTGTSNDWRIQTKSGTASLTTGASEMSISVLQSGGTISNTATQTGFFGFF